MPEAATDQFREDPRLPDALLTVLRQLHPPGPSVPPELDDQILRDARATYRARQRTWTRLRRIGAGLAAAAVLALAIRVYMPSDHHASPAARPQLAQLADTNHDGRVDILDAYTVARHIARHEALDPAWDINGDGVVDQKDVDLIAGMAVQTDREAPQ